MAKKTHIKVHTCKFVKASDLFNGYRKLMVKFAESAPPFSWGDNNLSLVTVEAILHHLDNSGISYDDEFEARCQAVGMQTYVDLEN